MKMEKRTIIILAIIILDAWLAWLKLVAQDICIIIGPVATPAGLYIGLKGKGGGNE